MLPRFFRVTLMERGCLEDTLLPPWFGPESRANTCEFIMLEPGGSLGFPVSIIPQRRKGNSKHSFALQSSFFDPHLSVLQVLFTSATTGVYLRNKSQTWGFKGPFLKQEESYLSLPWPLHTHLTYHQIPAAAQSPYNSGWKCRANGDWKVWVKVEGRLWQK